MGRPIAIVGAGISGLSAARRLKQFGYNPVVFEKSRSLGGRMATRRVDQLQFDHGAQHFTAKCAGFKAQIAKWRNAGVVAEWLDGSFVGTPGMTAPTRALAGGIDITPAVQVTALTYDDGLWTLRETKGSVVSRLNGRFSAVILALPAPQVVPLAVSAGLSAEDFRIPKMAPCWALMLSSARPLPIDEAFLRPQDSELAWIARDTSKPRRNADVHSYVVHATPEWSRANLELAPADILPMLMATLTRVVGQEIQPTFAAAHRWRYALVEKPLGRDFVWDEAARVGACGDWCIGGGRVESAFLSGLRLAETIHGDLKT